jgi:Tfp pilus assembly protein PilX
MTMINVKSKKRGVALAMVMVFCIAMLGLIGVLVSNTRSKRDSHSLQSDSTRALMAAASAVQLAVYKYRVLPSEFYKIHNLEMEVRSSTADSAAIARLGELKKAWMEDFQSENKGSPASIIKEKLDESTGANHSFGIEEFTVVSRAASGYTQDYLKVRAWGLSGETRKVLEELIEVKISK